MKILILATMPQRFLDQITFAEGLSSFHSKLDIYFFIGDNVLEQYPEKVTNLEFNIIQNKKNSSKISKNVKKSSYLQRFQKCIIDFLKKYFAGTVDFLMNSVFMQKILEQKEYNFTLKLLELKNELYPLIHQIKPDVMFINGDRHLGNEPAFLSIAKELSIVTIIPYMVYSSEEEGLVKSSMTNECNSFLISKYIKKAQNTFNHHKRKNKYFYPHYISNVLMEIGVLSKNPWFMGGGKSDILSLPNLHMKEHYINHGINEHKIKIIGDVSYDVLHKTYMQKDIIKEDIIKKYGLKKNKKIIIVSLPQLAEHDILTWDEHWQEVVFLLKNIDSLEQNVLISLHPKMDLKNYQFLETKYNCKILNERLSDVLVVADMFVATFSSTVLWSVLCDINTVVIDFYGLKYTMYDFLTSIKKVDNRKLLKQTLVNSLKEEIDFTEDWKNLSRDAIFDGKTIKRYFELIKDLK